MHIPERQQHYGITIKQSNVQLKEIMMKDEFLDKCIAFSVKINKLRKYLREKQHEYNRDSRR